jgi:hypothetical protein
MFSSFISTTFVSALIRVPVAIAPVYEWLLARTITSHLDLHRLSPLVLRLTPTRSQRLTKPQPDAANRARFFCRSLKLALPCQTEDVNAQIVTSWCEKALGSWW